jgi:hypothetical protein
MDLGGATPAANALRGLSDALDQLIGAVNDGGLDPLDNPELVGFLHDFEQLRNRMPLVDHQLLRTAADRDLPKVLCQGTLARVLTSALRISPGEASRRVRAADQPTGRLNIDGIPEWTPPKHVDRAQTPLINTRILTAHPTRAGAA